jgi:DNA invertase Pin-like site-specific DNA recombinase
MQFCTLNEPLVYTQTMTTTDTRPLALAYVRVSTTEQAENGASLDAQEAALIEAAERKGFRVEVLREEGRSGKSLRSRPVLTEALRRLRGKEAAALYAQRLDRLSRSVGDFAHLLERARREGWTVAVLDADVDTSTPSGEFLVNVLASAAQYERRIIGARTKDALAQRRREGVRLGRPSVLAPETVARIAALRAEGKSLRTIAADLEATGTATAHGGTRWHASTVRKVLDGQDAAALAA